MDSISLKKNFSRNTLLRMLIMALLVAGVLGWKIDLLNSVYFRDQLTDLGLVINGAIVALFALGLFRMLFLFTRYMREEEAITRFVDNITGREEEDEMHDVPADSLIAQRYRAMLRLHEAHTPINQSALAATLIASESTRTSLPKFINNTLILSGVFGTIVSLSIALIGASDLLENTVDTSGMGMVVHGMSTALSTTITAIVCYLFFGYFYLKLTDAQTNLVSAIEQVSTNFLMPRFNVQTESVLYEFTGLIRSLQGLVQQMQDSQKTTEAQQQAFRETMREQHVRIDGLATRLDKLGELLRRGFRLSEQD